MDEAVYRLERNGKRLRAGTTVVAVIITSRRMYWLSVGDSKLYLYRDGQILCPVAAHNYRLILDRQLAAGTIDREKYQEEEKRGEALISYIGIGGLTRIETNKQPFLLEPGDQVLLCSDGLYRSVSEDRIREVLGRTMLPDEKLSQLIGEALSNGGNGQDNTSAILIRG
jgi:protein phosphatase